MQYKMLIVPEGRAEPMRLELVHDDPGELARAVFGGLYPERSEVSFSMISGAKTQVCYDDLGLYRTDNQPNPRARQLWSKLLGYDHNVVGLLVGTFVFLGLRPDGETDDVPAQTVAAAQQMQLDELCPQAPDGGRHHFVQVPADGGETVCAHCTMPYSGLSL